MIKILQKMDIDGTNLNLIRAIYDIPTATIILNDKKLKAFLLRSGKRQGRPHFTTIIQHSSRSTSYSNQRRKRNKRNPDWKRSKALTVCRRHDTVHLENPKDRILKLLELISELSKVADIKSIHRNYLHFYIITMKNQKWKLRNQSHSPLQQK